MTKLSSPRRIVFDLDGVIAEGEDFPKIGKPTKGMKSLLNKLQAIGTKINIWSARFGLPDRHDKMGSRTTCVDQINDVSEWLQKNTFYYNDFFIQDKPWGSAEHQAEYIVDDKCIEFLNAVYLEERILRGAREKHAEHIYGKTKEKRLDTVLSLIEQYPISNDVAIENKEYILMRVLEMRGKDK